MGASIPPQEIAAWTKRLKERMATEAITVQEAYDREFAEHPDQEIVLDLARQWIRQEEAEQGSRPPN